MKTAIGVLSINKIEIINKSEISEDDALRAGYSDIRDLLNELNQREGDLYRISLAYAGEDPRVKLREENNLDDSAFFEIQKRLEQYDKSSRTGDWTHHTLTLIEGKPRVPAAELAVEAGLEKARFKANVRKLKNLGLTISKNPGYTLSPRGTAYLEQLKRQ